MLVYVFKYSLSDERFALRPQQVVLAVPIQQDHCPVLHLELSVILEAANLNVQTLWRLEVLSEVETRGAYGSHVARQRAVVSREPLDLLLAQTQLEGGRENAARLPPVVPDSPHAVVHVGQQTALVSLQTGVSQLDTCREWVVVEYAVKWRLKLGVWE